MDRLKECALEFKKLFRKDYYFTLENDVVIKLYFASKHFHHVMGLHKLTDIPSVVKSANNTPTSIFKNIERGRISYPTISNSIFFNDIKDRIDNFHHINSMIFEKAVINFDRTKVPSSNPSNIRSDIILYQDKGSYYLNLCLVNGNLSYSPETFLVQHDDYYIRNQDIHNIKELKICRSRSSTILDQKVYIEMVEETNDQVALTST